MTEKHQKQRKKGKRRRKKKRTDQDGKRLDSNISSNNQSSKEVSDGSNEFSKESAEDVIKKSSKKRRKRSKKNSKLSSLGSSGEENSSGKNSQNSSLGKVTFGRRNNQDDSNRKKIDRGSISPKPQPGMDKSEASSLVKNDKRKMESFNVSPNKSNSRSRSSSSASSKSLLQQALIKRKIHVYYDFIEATIKEDSIYELTGITLNTFFLLRLILLEVMMIVLQTMPLVQVLIMNFINIAYLMWVLRAIFKDKVVEETCDIIHIMVLEIAIQVFLLCCIVFWMNKNDDFLNTIGSIVFQMICVLAIGFSVIFELIMLIVNLVKNIGKAYKRRKMMKEQINGVMAEVLGRKDIGRVQGMNYRGIDKLNARMRRGF